MSEWHEADEKEIDIDHADREVSIFVKADNSGRVYLSLSFDQIKRLASLIESPEAKS